MKNQTRQIRPRPASNRNGSVDHFLELVLTLVDATSVAGIFGLSDNAYLGEVGRGDLRFNTSFLKPHKHEDGATFGRVVGFSSDIPVSDDKIMANGIVLTVNHGEEGAFKALSFEIDDGTVDVFVYRPRHMETGFGTDQNASLLLMLWQLVRDACLQIDDSVATDVSLPVIQAILDATPAPTILVRSDRSIVASNSQAAAELSAGDSVQQFNQFLVTTVRAETQLLQNALQAVATATEPTARAVLVTNMKGDERVILEVRRLMIPLSSWAEIEPLCTVTLLRKVDFVSASRIAAAYGLTYSEQRLVARLATGSNVKEAAKAVGIKESSARTYIKRVFMKMGVSRQAELISLLSSQGALLRSDCNDTTGAQTKDG